MAHLTNTERAQVEQALGELERLAAEHAHDPLPNRLLPAVDEIRKALDLDSDIPEWMHSERYTPDELALLAGTYDWR